MATITCPTEHIGALDRNLEETESRLRKGNIVFVGCSNPRLVADRFWQKAAGERIHYHQSVPHRYCRDEGVYKAVDPGDFRAELVSFIERLYIEQTASWMAHFDGKYADQFRQRPLRSGFVNDVLDSLKAMTNVDASVTLPTWLPARTGQFLSMVNGIIQLDTLIAEGSVKIDPHSPAFFTLNRLPFSYNAAATCRRWEAFLGEVLEGDVQRIRLLQEWFGYCLTPSARLQKFLLMEGNGANGKSVIVKVQEGLLGANNISSVPLEVFAERFALSATYGKLLNVCSEASALSPRVEGLVKQYVAGDLMTTDRKHIPPLQFHPTARILITTNNRPKVADESDGMWRRMLVLPFRVTIPEDRQDRHLAETLLSTEAAGIFNWAIEGLKRLNATEQFTTADVSQAAVKEYRADDNPVRAFSEMHIQCGEGEVPVQALYNAFQSYCEWSGDKAVPIRDFGKSLRRLFPALKPRQGRRDGHVISIYHGILLVGMPTITSTAVSL